MSTDTAIVAGPDEDGIAAALETEGVDVVRINGVISRPTLEEAGIIDADLYVLTDIGQATTVPIVCDLTDDVRTVVYARDTIPEFIKGQLDLAVDPQLMDAAIVAEELTA
ncbi:CTP synthetase [Natronorubrum sp. JWXQ-INN-674]|uniref:CTP synthetase n=1 Tax=Natronorubrum halalkaliphilum TaxID=2691917 RepID=A0A6B0VSI9_9EURY|nr:CTP synthetase [Natronorubrum halalkaliphilum]MXV63469.1 CTP synthetase [Natronorubrum halalkaliphilum]